MKKGTFGGMITSLRKENGMMQLELAEIFHVSIDELMQMKAGKAEKASGKNASQIVNLILKGVALAMGIAVFTRKIINSILFSDRLHHRF